MELEFDVGDVVSEIGYPDKWVVMGSRKRDDSYFVCEVENGKRYGNVIRLEFPTTTRLVKVGCWNFPMNCEYIDDGVGNGS